MSPFTIIKIAAGTFVLLFIAIVTGGSFFTVDQSEKAVILRNGAVTSVAAAGLHFKMPMIDDYKLFSMQSQAILYENEPVYSRDQQAATITFSINYTPIPDDGIVSSMYKEFGSYDRVQSRRIDRQAREAIKNVFGQFNAVTAIQERSRLSSELENIVREIDTNGIVKIESVQIENIDFSDAYEDSVEKRMLAEVEVQKIRQNAEREKVEAEITVTKASAQRDSQIALATATAASIEKEGEARAKATRLAGAAEADAIKAKGAALAANPGLTDLIKAERWDGKLPSTMVPGSAVPFISIK